MSSITIPNSIKNNNQELLDFLDDLNRWEKDIKAEDIKLLEKGKAVNNHEQSSNDVPMLNNKSIKLEDCPKIDKEQIKMNTKNQEIAEKLKEEGNKFYSQGKLDKAVNKYEEGINLDPSNALLFANRAMAYIKLEKYEEAVSDCDKCIEIDCKYIKAYLRRATAFSKLLNLSAAIKDYNKVLKIEPWNKDAKRELEKLNSKLKKEDKINSKLEKHLKSPTGDSSTTRPIEKKMELNECNSELERNIQSSDDDSNNLLELKFPQKREVSFSNRVVRLKPTTPKEVSPIKIVKHSKLQDPPPPPRNSHQFYLDWKKVSNYDALAEAYLLSIPGSFFHGIEIDVDQLVEVVHHLNGESIEPHVIVDLLQSLMQSRGFYLNLAFLESEQKKEFEIIIKKVEDHGLINENIRKIKKSLSL